MKERVTLTLELEEHTPTGSNPCKECILVVGVFGCLDKSLCKYRETGKTWKKLDKSK